MSFNTLSAHIELEALKTKIPVIAPGIAPVVRHGVYELIDTIKSVLI